MGANAILGLSAGEYQEYSFEHVLEPGPPWTIIINGRGIEYDARQHIDHHPKFEQSYNILWPTVNTERYQEGG